MMKSIESFPPHQEITSNDEETFEEEFKVESEGLKEDQEGVKSARLELKLKIGEKLKAGLGIVLIVNLLAGALGSKAEAAELVKEAQNQEDEKIQIDQQTRPTLEEQLPELDLEGQKVEGGVDDEDKKGTEEVSSNEQIFDNLPEKVTLEFPSNYTDAEKEHVQKYFDQYLDVAHEMVKQFNESWKAQYSDEESFAIFEQSVKDKIVERIKGLNERIDILKSEKDKFHTRRSLGGENRVRASAKGELDGVYYELIDAKKIVDFREFTE